MENEQKTEVKETAEETKKPAESELQQAIKQLKGFMTDKLDKQERTYQKQLAEVMAAQTGLSASIKPEDETLKTQHAEALKRVQELESKWKESDEKATKLETERQKAEELTALTTILAANNSNNIRGAIALLREDGKIFRKESGELMFHGSVKDVSVDVGIKEWLGTEEGQQYVIPKGVSGSGATPSAPKKSSQKMSKEEQDNVLAGWFNGRSSGF